VERVDSAGQRRARVLVVDDESGIRRACKRILERSGFVAITANNGNEALRIMAEEGIDVVLLDIKMPGLSGIEVLKGIKQNYPETEVIMITGYATIQTVTEAMKIGAYDYLTKPFEDISQISECVEKAFSRKKSLEAKMAREKQLLERLYKLEEKDRKYREKIVSLSKKGAWTPSNISNLKVECLWEVRGTYASDISHKDPVFSVSLSPDGGILASGGRDKTIKLWEVNTGKLLKTLEGHTWTIFSISFSPDGKILASGSADTSIKLWKVSSEDLPKTLVGHQDWVSSVSFSPDGRILASGSRDKTIKLWHVFSGSLLKTLEGHGAQVLSVSFSPDGGILASGSADHTVKLWEVESGRLLKALEGHINPVLSVAFSPSGRILASGSRDKTVKLWEVESGRLLKTLKGHNAQVLSLSFSPDGRILASGSDDHDISLWDASSGALVRRILRGISGGHKGGVSSVSFSPDGRILASGSGA